MRDNVYSKHLIAAFLIIFMQVFYEFPIDLLLVKLFVIGVCFFLFLVVPLIERKNYIEYNSISLIFSLYVVVLIVSSIQNLWSSYYSIKNAIIGIAVLIIPISIYFQTVNQDSLVQGLRDSAKLQKGIVIAAFIVLVVVLFTGRYVGNVTGVGYRFSGLVVSPSMIGLNASLLISYSLIHFIEYKKRLYLIPIALSMVLIVMSLSKSGIIITVMGFVYVAIIKKRFLEIFSILAVLVLIVIIVLPIDLFVNVILLQVESGSIDTLSGRDAIWETCRELISQKPLLGYGYNSSLTILPVSFPSFLVEQAHNVYYESMLNVGFVGTILLGAYVLKVLITCMVNFSYLTKHPELSWFFFLVIMGIVRGFTEASFAQANNLVDIFIFFISLFVLDFYCSPESRKRMVAIER